MWGQKSSPDKEAIGRSRGGSSIKIHATVDALGNPIGFSLTPGQVHDSEGADRLLPEVESKIVIADKGYAAQERMFRTLMEMWHEAEHFNSGAHRKNSLLRFINFYNRVKPHKALGDATPGEKLSACFFPDFVNNA